MKANRYVSDGPHYKKNKARHPISDTIIDEIKWHGPRQATATLRRMQVFLVEPVSLVFQVWHTQHYSIV